MDVAAEGNRTESLSVLMDVRKELFPKKKKTLNCKEKKAENHMADTKKTYKKMKK